MQITATAGWLLCKRKFWKMSKLKARENILRIEFLGVGEGAAGSFCLKWPKLTLWAYPKTLHVPKVCPIPHLSPVLRERAGPFRVGRFELTCYSRSQHYLQFQGVQPRVAVLACMLQNQSQGCAPLGSRVGPPQQINPEVCASPCLTPLKILPSGWE